MQYQVVYQVPTSTYFLERSSKQLKHQKSRNDRFTNFVSNPLTTLHPYNMSFASLLRSVSLLAFASNALAYPGGAGRCVVGGPSPTGPHGSKYDPLLESADYEIIVEGADMKLITDKFGETTATITAEAGVEFNVTVAGPAYRGYLFLVADQPETAITDIGTGLKFADCGGAAVTQTSRSTKFSSTTLVLVEDPVETTIDFNIVVSTQDYLYGQVALEVVV